MALGLETLYLSIKHTNAICIALLGTLTQQLLSNADAKHGLFQIADNFIQPAGFQVFHSTSSLALAWKYDTFCLNQQFWIVC